MFHTTKLKLTQATALFILFTALLLGVPSDTAFCSEKEHWASSTLLELQEDGLYKTRTFTFNEFNQVIAYAEFESMLSELLSLHKIDSNIKPTIKNHMTRSEAAEQLYLALANQLKPIDLSLQTKAFDWSVHYKILTKDSKGNFNPQRKLTLGEGVAIMKKVHLLLTESEKRAIEDALSGNITVPNANQRTDVTYELLQNDAQSTKLILSWGKKSTGGYTIRIQQIDLKNDNLIVYYNVSEPRAGAMTTQVISYPKDDRIINLPIEKVNTLKILLVEAIQ